MELIKNLLEEYLFLPQYSGYAPEQKRRFHNRDVCDTRLAGVHPPKNDRFQSLCRPASDALCPIPAFPYHFHLLVRALYQFFAIFQSVYSELYINES